MDLGGGLTVAAYRQCIADAETALNDYNTKLGEADVALNAYQAGEKKLRDLSERMLTGVATRYGKDSSEYEKAGGKRKSERKRPTRKQSAPSK